VKIKCGWCDKDMGEKPPFDNDQVSHGICPECYEAVTHPPVCVRCGRFLIRPQHIDYAEEPDGKVCMVCLGGS